MDEDDAEYESEGDDEEAVSLLPSRRSVRRSPVQMDALRARMIQEGYPLAELPRRDNDRVRQSLTQQRRWPQLVALTGMSEAALWERVKALRKQHQTETGKR